MQTLKKLIAIASVALAPMAHAASGQSFLDLSQMTIQYVGLSGTYSHSIDYNFGKVSANDMSVSKASASFFGGVFDETVSDGGATAMGFSGTGIQSTGAIADAGLASVTVTNSFSSLSLSGTGYVIITIPYAMAVNTVALTDDSASAQVGITVVGSYGQSSQAKYTSTLSLFGNQGSDITESGVLSLVFFQASGVASHYSLSIRIASAAASTLPAITAVPEPETYAMLLAGLGLMGVVARRRRNVA